MVRIMIRAGEGISERLQCSKQKSVGLRWDE
jgi:hypothetical protein